MNKTIKFILFLVAIFAISLIVPNFSKAATTVTDESSLLSAISSVSDGETITLQNNITVTAPIVIQKEIIIDGNGYTITGSSDWTSTSGNQTMFTAQFSAGKLTLKNVNLQNGPKYGVQSYDGATVILNNASITGFKYGGVLANGGNVEIIDLHLGYNGTTANNGIEIAKGAAATNNPTLTMNGVLTSDTTENVVRVAENDSLTEFTITNTPNTTNKVVLTDNSIVLTDENNNVVAESSVPDKVTGNADEQKVIVTVIANDQEIRFTANEGTMITADLVSSHIVLEDNEKIDGYYTSADYTTEFNFNEALNADTTIYAKISTVEATIPEEPVQEPETEVKDETPKTGVENYLGLAVLTIILALTIIVGMKRKEQN